MTKNHSEKPSGTEESASAKERHAKSASERAPDSGGELADRGLGGPVIEKHSFRVDCRRAAALISLGVVSADRAREILAQGLRMAEASGKAHRPREWAAIMKVVLAVADLEDKVATRHQRELDASELTVRQLLGHDGAD